MLSISFRIKHRSLALTYKVPHDLNLHLSPITFLLTYYIKVNNYMKKCSTSLFSMEMKLKIKNSKSELTIPGVGKEDEQ